MAGPLASGPRRIWVGATTPFDRPQRPVQKAPRQESRGLCSGPKGTQNGGGSLKSPRSAWRSRPWVRSPLPCWLARSTLAVANLWLAPTSSASISANDRFSPSGVSQVRWRSRPVTRTPLESESARCSACYTFTLKNEVSSSRHSPSCWTRWVTATPQVGDRGAGVGEPQFGVLDQVPGDGGLVVGCH
jgi:hypothetical protein